MTSKRYSPKVKFQAVIEVVGGKALSSVAKAYGAHPTSLSHWRNQVMEKGPEIFSSSSEVAKYEKKVRELEQLLGKKEMEIALLKNFLGQVS